MSLKATLLYEIAIKPRRAKYLKQKFGSSKEFQSKLDQLVLSGKVTKENGYYSLTAPKNTKKNKNNKAKPRDDIRQKAGKSLPKNTTRCTLVKLAPLFGFATPMVGDEDIFIPGKYLNGAMVGDIIMVEVFRTSSKSGKAEGRVRAIEKQKNSLVGTIHLSKGQFFVEPDNGKGNMIRVESGYNCGALPGEKVAAEIVKRGDSHKANIARVVMRFGSEESAKNCAHAIIYGADIHTTFPKKVMQQASAYEDAVVSEEDILPRRDLRDDIIFTIDGADTKDIDDAISLVRVNNGYQLGVHIADVSHYVKADTPLDENAFKRGTSIYYAQSVVPMLPKELSNGICSLNPKVDRLAFSCIINLDDNGNVTKYHFVKTVIHSKVKGVYDEINTLLSGEETEDIKNKYAHVNDTLFMMQELYHKLQKLRNDRGSMNIESGEAKLEIDEKGVCVGIHKRTRGVSECMIEEFMLLANGCAANLAKKMEIPFIYRVHDLPELGRVETLMQNLQAFGIYPNFKEEVPSQTELSILLDETRDTTLERAVHMNILRTMAKAKYSTTPKGHYGLSLADYAHFTSPIRRYPDLGIHRILSDVVAGMSKEKLKKTYSRFANTASEQSSNREVVAMQVERGCEDCYKAEYMKQFVGECFDAVISGVTSSGIFVELDNTVEGLIRNNTITKGEMDYIYGVSVTIVEKDITYKIGDIVKVRVVATDVADGNVDFELV